MSKMVKELILDNDMVVLPGLGSFVAETVPSTFSDRGYTINPPYRRLYFRARPVDGDELAELYAASNSLSLDVARRIIADFIVEMRAVLFARKMVVFPGLGRLRATKENNVFFVADEDLDIYPEGFGLEPVSLKTQNESAEQVAAAVGELASILDETAPEDTLSDVLSVSHVEDIKTPDFVQEAGVVDTQMPEPTLESTSEPIPESIPEPAPEPIPDTVPEPTPDAVPEQLSVPNDKQHGPGRILLLVVLCLISLAVLLLIALAVLGRLAPDFVDGLLYSAEELEILKR